MYLLKKLLSNSKITAYFLRYRRNMWRTDFNTKYIQFYTFYRLRATNISIKTKKNTNVTSVTVSSNF